MLRGEDYCRAAFQGLLNSWPSGSVTGTALSDWTSSHTALSSPSGIACFIRVTRLSTHWFFWNAKSSRTGST